MKKVHAEIEYFTDPKKCNIHSDICPPKCDYKNIDDDYKKFLHQCLDEWLNKSEGTGIFYIKQDGYDHFKDLDYQKWLEEEVIKLGGKI